MGYNCKIRTKEVVKVKDVQDIINELPEDLSLLGNQKQAWGWSCRCDVYKPSGKCLEISGSYGISGNIKDAFISYMKDQLINKGYEVTKIVEA